MSTGTGRRPGLTYVLPLHDPDTEQHFYYLQALLERLAGRFSLHVIVERAAGPVTVPGARRVRVQRFRWGPARAVEMLAYVVEGVVRGHRKIYVHYSTFGAAAAVLARLLGARAYYWNCEENAEHFRPWAPSREALAHKLRAELPTSTVIRLSDVLVTGNATMARYYRRVYGLGPRRVRIVPSWFDPSRFHPGPPPPRMRERLGLQDGERVLLFVHRLSPRKGARELPGIFAALAREVPEAVLVVAGDGPDRPWLAGELQRRNLSSRARLLGNVPNREIGDLYRAADLLLMPSRAEGFPRVLVEAQASGVPFVATQVGGVADAVSPLARSHCLAPRGDTEAFVRRSLALLVGDSGLALRRQLSCRGLDFVQSFRPDAALERLVAVLREHPCTWS